MNKKLIIVIGIIAIIIAFIVLILLNVVDFKPKKKIINLYDTSYIAEDTSSQKENTIDKMYKIFNVKSVEEIPLDYSFNEAVNDGYLVHTISTSANAKMVDSFFENYNNKQDAFLRYITATVEGDMLIIDTLYDSSKDTIYVVRDERRDMFNSEDERIISYYNYQKVIKVENEGITKIYSYLGSFNENNIHNNDSMLVGII